MIQDDAKIQAFIDRWRKILLMDDWHIVWQWDDNMGHDEQVHVWHSERRMKISLAHRILDYTPDECEDTIAHAMIHGITWPIDDYVRPWIEEYFPNIIMVPFWKNYNDIADNVVVETILRVLKARGANE